MVLIHSADCKFNPTNLQYIYATSQHWKSWTGNKWTNFPSFNRRVYSHLIMHKPSRQQI